MSFNWDFTRDSIDTYLRELSKEYRKRAGKNMPAELILIGGAAILINYGFRNMTTDIDALIYASSPMKDAINYVGDKYSLPNGWLNSDFKSTDSYSERLSQFSTYYKTYSNIVTVRSVKAEYLIAMKLRSGRQYKNDMSDILGILADHKKNGNPITFDQIRKAVNDLYGRWEVLPASSQAFIENVLQNGQYEELYQEIVKDEQATKELLIDFEQEYPGVTKETNVDIIAGNLQKSTDRATILATLRARAEENGENKQVRKKGKKR